MLDLLIIGPYSPPFGGIANHIRRLTYFLIKEKISFIVYNHGNFSEKGVIPNHKSFIWYVSFLFKKINARIVHFHQSLLGFEFIYWFLFTLLHKANIIITLHNDYILKSTPFNRLNLFLLNILSKKNTILVVNREVSKLLQKRNIPNCWLPAYVPPKLNDIETKSINCVKKKIAFAIFRVKKENLIDTYGFDLAMGLMQKVKSEYSLLIFVGDKENSDLEFLFKVVDDYDNGDCVEYFYNQDLLKYLSNCDVLIRPTRKDGYGVSLLEALDLNVPCIASDICERPEGTILFKSGSLNDLYEKFQYFQNTPKIEILINKMNTLYHLELIEIYKKLLNRQNETNNPVSKNR